MSSMFEPLYEQVQKGRAVFIEDAFFTYTYHEKGDFVWAANFFSMNDEATVKLLARLEKIADGRPIRISIHKDEGFGPEARVVSRSGYTLKPKEQTMQHWEKNNVAHAA